jgi:type II restriction/modification system DNA methylase subunit YeeA
METTKLKKFAQFARRSLMEQVSSKLKLVLDSESAARRQQPEAIKSLEGAIREHGKEQVIERVAYIWFNRFCALRFMDVNRYTRVGVVSPAVGQFQPEILAEAKMGHIDEEMVHDKARQQIFALLEGKTPSRDPQGEGYRLLVVAACNYWHKAMPFLFQRIEDYSELLMPDDLLSGNSILAFTREALTPDACQDVEVIGWLYQFYISEKKDEVFEGLKKNKKITPKNIPAATQLFTPHWIVRYLVENSLGRLWMLNRPGSKLIERMDYYIKPEKAETDFLSIGKPEEIKICDPACGSGHMLTYVFDLLYAIYEEEGYEPAEIPEKILTHNLYGIEIDERAGELAAFALTMKARAKQRRFFSKGVKPNICVLENVRFDEGELTNYMDFVGRDLFPESLQTTLRQFEEADNFGSLIRPAIADVQWVLKTLESKKIAGHLFLTRTHQKVIQVLRQADYLSPKYHVVIANPPYMGSKGMNGRLGAWAKENFPNSKSDLFAMFIERNLDLARKHGMVAMITMQSWMFLSSFEKLRANLLNNFTIVGMAHIGPRGFDSIGGEVVSTTAFIISNNVDRFYVGDYFRLVDGNSESDKVSMFLKCEEESIHYRLSTLDFKKIPGSPIAYWASPQKLSLFDKQPISEVCNASFGIKTGNNDIFMHYWFELESGEIEFKEDGRSLNKRWYPCASGGTYRKWYGNQELVVDYENEGERIRTHGEKHGNSFGFFGRNNYFKRLLTWPKLTMGANSFRITPPGQIFDGVGLSASFETDEVQDKALLFLNSRVAESIIPMIAPTMSLTSGDFLKLPFGKAEATHPAAARALIDLAKSDWDSYETSWDFTNLPLQSTDYRQPTLKATYQKLRAHWLEQTLEMQRLEEENNRIFIEAYGLQDELTPEVPLNEVTLTCNPHYRYGNGKSEEELETLLRADTMRELVSYAVGCMFGRYSLDKPGLILANQGETVKDYLRQVPNPTFSPDEDNVIPMLDGDWFPDDITERFKKFLRVAFGEEHYEENLAFLEGALNVKGKQNYTLRDFFLGEFYNDHLKRYKKRPIYWLFSSPKGSFNALIYMHRYRPDTVSVVLNKYLREFRAKLVSYKNQMEAVSISAKASQAEKTRGLKEIERVSRILVELEDYEREVLYPLATRQVEIDLDDGVKVNYPKFGAALKRIPGLDATED